MAELASKPALGTEAINFENANLSGAKLSGMDFSGANFKCANMMEVDLSYANLSNAQFISANLRNANFQHANLTNANFKKSDLQGAKLNATQLIGANFESAQLYNANFSSLPEKAETYLDGHKSQKPYDQLKKMAFYDVVTGIYNRQAFEEFFQKALQDMLRYRSGAAFLLLDLDHFKAVNDTYGHLIGDGLLKQVAARLQTIVRQGDLLARFGGDEFAIFLKNIHDEVDPGLIAKKIVTLLQEPYLIDEISAHVTVSVGICYWQTDSELSAQEIISRADIALYRSKSNGRNTFQYYSKFLHRKHKENVALVHSIQSAIKENKINFLFQPIAFLKDNRVFGFEVKSICLGDHGSKFDADYIRQVIRDTHLIELFEKQYLSKSLKKMSEWNKKYQTLNDTPELHLSLSFIYLSHTHFFTHLDEILERYAIPPEKINIGFTESQFKVENKSLLTLLEKIRDMKVNVILDHYTGETISFFELNKLPISKIKIAASLISELNKDNHKRILVQSIIHFTQGLHIFSIAEGVDHEWQAIQLNHFSCDAMLGSYAGHLLTGDEVSNFLEK